MEEIGRGEQDPETIQYQFVIFQIGSQNCAAPVHQVQEVLAYGNITPLPQSSPFLEGVIDLRGTLIPVIDLRKRMGFPDLKVEMRAQLRSHNCARILVIRAREKVLGAVVDSVEQVITVSPESIQPPPEGASTHGIDYVLAFVKEKNQLFLVLDLDRVLTSNDPLPVFQV